MLCANLISLSNLFSLKIHNYFIDTGHGDVCIARLVYQSSFTSYGNWCAKLGKRADSSLGTTYIQCFDSSRKFEDDVKYMILRRIIALISENSVEFAP